MVLVTIIYASLKCCLIKTFELKPVYYFSLHNAMKGLDVGVFFGCGNVGELLLGFCTG